MQTYKSPEEALKFGIGPRAMGDVMVEVRGTYQKMNIVFQQGRQPYIAYYGSPGIKFRDATTREVNSAIRWRNMMGD